MGTSPSAPLGVDWARVTAWAGMREVGIQEAKTQLSKLLREVEDGTEVVILRGGKHVARLVALGAPARPRACPARVLGADRDALVVPDDFDAPLPEEVLDGFES